MLEHQSFLDKMVTHKKEEVMQRKKANPRALLLQGLQASDRNLEQALARLGNRFILEYKRASPSQGVINSNLEVDDICVAYNGFADAVSVLTDSKFFDGSFENLRRVRDKVNVPVLCKDFILDPYQVVEARYFGADAILLMLSILDDQQYQECAVLARRYDMDILTEVHTEEEVARAIKLDARIIGINNRDLKTLKTDISLTEKLAQKIPSDRLVISESGITSRKDIAQLSRHVDGFLIGTALTASQDVRSAVKRLLFGEVKICGIKNWSDASIAESSGASYLGLMCYEKSPRFIPFKVAETVVRSVKAKYVGIFVNASVEEMLGVAHRLSLFAVQCQGNETIELLIKLKQQLPSQVQLWKAVRYTEPTIHHQISHFESYVDRLLVDKFTSEAYGGSGQRFDWQAIEKIQASMKHPQKLILAGGISLDNVHELEVHPELTLDISSGVEGLKGVKSIDKIHRLFTHRRFTSKERQVITSHSQRRAV
jgi:indole-3-glycerol phosphate synthase / phosphoribosylanthranilate isomerase